MPQAARIPCITPRCPGFTVARGRCEACRRRREKSRGSSADRLYDAVWQRFRAFFLRSHPLCADCERQPAVDVHHKVKLRERPDLRLVEDNCRGLCHACHARRTAQGE